VFVRLLSLSLSVCLFLGLAARDNRPTSAKDKHELPALPSSRAVLPAAAATAAAAAAARSAPAADRSTSRSHDKSRQAADARRHDDAPTLNLTQPFFLIGRRAFSRAARGRLRRDAGRASKTSRPLSRTPVARFADSTEAGAATGRDRERKRETLRPSFLPVSGVSGEINVAAACRAIRLRDCCLLAGTELFFCLKGC
jgi:hypothetical protein